MMNDINSFLQSCIHLADQILASFNRTTVRARSKSYAHRIADEARGAQAASNDPVAFEWHISNIQTALKDIQTDDLARVALEDPVDSVLGQNLLPIVDSSTNFDMSLGEIIRRADQKLANVFIDDQSAVNASTRLSLSIEQLYQALVDEVIPKPAAVKGSDGIKRFSFDRMWLDAAKAALQRKGEIEASDDPEADDELEGEDLRAVVPPEQVSPIKLEIIDGKLAIAPQPAEPLPGSSINAHAAVDELVTNGKDIVSSLGDANADKRLISAAEDLQKKLESEINITQLALANIRFEIMYLSVEDELPSTLLAMLKAHTMAIGMYVGQFSEWHSFVENAASANLTQSAIEEIKSATENVLQEISERSDIVEPEVPRSIKIVLEFLNRPSLASKKAAFALLLTLEEFVRRTYSYVADFLDKTIRKSSDRASEAISRGVAVGLITLGVFVASNMSGAVAQVGQGWVKTAKQVGEQALKELTQKQP